MGASRVNGVESGILKVHEIQAIKPGSFYGARHTQVIMLFLLIMLAYGMRGTLSVSIVAMTNPNASSNEDVPTYDWDDKSIMLSSFFWGYIVPQIGAGQLAKYYGPKYFLVITMTVGSLLHILIPFVAGFGSWTVIVCRVGQGLTQGFFFPSCHHLLSKWVPPSERARLGTFVYAGNSFGTVISLPFTGWISGTHLGWPYAYYIYGAAGLLWAAVWTIVGKNSPRSHGTMDPKEREYIESSLGESEKLKDIPTPWKAFALSLPLWAVFVAQFGENWGYTTLLTNIPTYMSDVLNFDIKSNGVLSAGPYFVFWMLSFLFSSITDYVITNRISSTGIARKTVNTIGSVVPAVALIILGVLGTTTSEITNAALVLLFVAVGVNSACFCGYQVNHMDLSPKHSGTMMGITNGFSNIASIIGPLIVQFIVAERGNPYQWATVFYISASIFFLGNLFFVIFGSGEIQPWNDQEEKGPTLPKSDKERY
ncbi:hypothetical protein FQA39_LY03074 [Lamprigera yunnana]|nr:hypothetical protein FQA39_LY03074 [Lamprigera yunnana]